MRLSLLFASALIASCATTESAKTSASNTTAQTKEEAPATARFEDMLTREKEPVGTQSMVLEGHNIEVEAAGPVTVTPATERLRGTLNLALGTQSPMTCMVYQEAVDGAFLITKIVNGIKDKVDLLSVRPTHLEVIEKVPALFVEVVYSTRTEPKAAGQLKLMVYAHDTAPLMCLLDEPGYAATFRRVSGKFAQGLARAYTDPAQKFVYRSVSSIKMGELLSGYERTTWQQQGDMTVMVTSSVGLLPRSPIDWISQDDASVTWADKDGFIRKEQNVSISSGQLARSMALERKKGGTYTYQGEVQGKQLKGELKTADGKGLKSDKLFSQLIAKTLLTGKKTELTGEDYDASLDPSALTKVVAKKGAGADEVSVTSGGITLQGTVDGAGLFKVAQMTVGPVSIKMERVFVEGPQE